tara:strand:+ start:11684 stop:12145 length:462 start_codon:yes stop_codon:yes gene_type:complete
MAKGKKSKKELSSVQKIEIGVGLTAAAVAAAGAYFLYGSKNASKNRKAVKSWALKAKADVLEKLEEAKEMTRGEYEDLLTAAVGAYGSAKTVTKKDVKEFTTEMMSHWEALEKSMTKKKKPAKKTAKKAAKRVAKKPAKKTVKKAAKKTTKKK